MHKLLVRAIITGFGLRVGSELGKYLASKVLPKKESDENDDEDDEDDDLGTIDAEPPKV